eukprot:gene14094-15566_t
MAIKKKDFQKLLTTIKEFQGKLNCDESCAELRDALNLSLLHLHKYYKRFRIKSQNGASCSLEKSISLSSSLTGATSPISPYITTVDKFDWRWINLDVKKLSASFGYGDRINYVPEIFHVIRDCDLEKLKSMLEERQDLVNEVDAIGRNTAMYAVQGGTQQYIDCLELLISNGVDLQHQANDGISCMHMAVYYDYKEIIDILIKQEVELNVKDAEDRTPLHFAAANCSMDILKTLLENGADVSIQDREGLTAAMWACHFDQLENLQLILSYEKKINPSPEAVYQIVDSSGATILHWSVTRTININCFKYLINSETAHLCDDNDKSVFLWAAEHGCLLACEEIFEVCSDDIIDDVDNLGRSALHLATIGGHGEVVDLLLNKGARYEDCDKQGAIAMDYAISRKLNYCIMVFTSYQKYRERLQNMHAKLSAPNNAKQISSVKDKDANTHAREQGKDLTQNEDKKEAINGNEDKKEEATIEEQEIDKNQSNNAAIEESVKKLEQAQIKEQDLTEKQKNIVQAIEKLDVQDAIGFEVEGDIDEDADQHAEEDIEFEYEEDHVEGEEFDYNDKQIKVHANGVHQVNPGHEVKENNNVDNKSNEGRQEDDKEGVKKKDEEDKVCEDDGLRCIDEEQVVTKEDELGKNANVSIEESSFDLDDQMIVLVAHHGSDDDMVIEYGNEANNVEDQSDRAGANEAAKLEPMVDRDLFETSRLSPRIESVTGLMETNTMPANHSASVNMSVSSLCSDDGSADERDAGDDDYDDEEINAGKGEIKSELKAPFYGEPDQLDYRSQLPKQRLQRQLNSRQQQQQQLPHFTDEDRPTASHGKRKDKKVKKEKKSTSPRAKPEHHYQQQQQQQQQQQRFPIGALEPMKPLQPLLAPQGFPPQRNNFSAAPTYSDFMLPQSPPRVGLSSPSESPRNLKGHQLQTTQFGFGSSHIPRPSSPRGERDDHHSFGSLGVFPRPPLGK